MSCSCATRLVGRHWSLLDCRPIRKRARSLRSVRDRRPLVETNPPAAEAPNPNRCPERSPTRSPGLHLVGGQHDIVGERHSREVLDDDLGRWSGTEHLEHPVTIPAPPARSELEKRIVKD